MITDIKRRIERLSRRGNANYRLGKKVRDFWRIKTAARRRLFISENDFVRLCAMLKKQRCQGLLKKTKLTIFHNMLRRMTLTPLRRIPSDIITMNSEFVLTSKGGRQYEACLIYPDGNGNGNGNGKNEILITSWLGLMLLGKHEGDFVRGLFIDSIIYQPEEGTDDL